MEQPNNRKTVLIIDDSSVVREQVRTIITEQPAIEVIGEAEDIAAGLSLIRENEPQFVILDVSMPGGNGFSLLEYVKTHYPATKVVILSNFSDVCYRSQAEILGADFFFDKSIEFDKIISAILEPHYTQCNLL